MKSISVTLDELGALAVDAEGTEDADGVIEVAARRCGGSLEVAVRMTVARPGLRRSLAPGRRIVRRKAAV